MLVEFIKDPKYVVVLVMSFRRHPYIKSLQKFAHRQFENISFYGMFHLNDIYSLREDIIIQQASFW
jgi:hypothetical protein